VRGLWCSLVQSGAISDIRADRNQVPALPAIQHSTAFEPHQTDRRGSGIGDKALWTYVPTSALNRAICSASHSALDTLVSTSACTSPNPTTELWLSSSGKATRRQLSWRGWRTRPWVKRLSGTILEPSMAGHGVAAFISSLPAIPANPSATPAGEAVRTIHDISGPMSPESWRRQRRSGSFARTSRGTCHWDTPRSRPTFDAWATTQRRACSRRERSALATAGAGSLSWPTPTASDAGYIPDLVVEAGRVGITSPTDISAGSGGQYSLERSTRVWTKLWLVLRALGVSMASLTTPSSLPVRVSFKNGNGCFYAGLISNPQFYELMMGWPIGWTAPEAPVMGFPAWLQRSRGRFSRLLTEFQDDG